MKAQHLELTNFRNYESQQLDFGDGVNVIYGDNAQGKTNILEAVYFFSMGKSNRARRDVELIRHGCDSAKVLLNFTDSERENLAEAEIFRDKRKRITLNEIPIRKNSELVRRFFVVYFGPEYLGLVKDGPRIRRQNFDILISQMRPGYLGALGELKKIVDSKNALLRMEHPNLTMLDIMDEKLIDISSNIICYRDYYINRIGSIAAEIQNEISGGKEKLEFRYNSCAGNVRGMCAEDIAKLMRTKVAEARQREMRLCETVIGPHREDIEFWVNDAEAKLFASQGQQKTIVMAEKLAEVELIRTEIGERPVLLLDDIMSELDRSRREYILGATKHLQIWITCTDTDGMDVPPEARRIEVSDGHAEIIA